MQVLDALFKECRKTNVLYRTTAMDSLGGILEVYKIDKFGDVFKLVQKTINPVSLSCCVSIGCSFVYACMLCG